MALSMPSNEFDISVLNFAPLTFAVTFFRGSNIIDHLSLEMALSYCSLIDANSIPEEKKIGPWARPH